MSRSHMGINSFRIPMQLLADGLGKALKNSPSIWAPDTCVGRPTRKPCLLVLVWPSLTAEAI